MVYVLMYDSTPLAVYPDRDLAEADCTRVGRRLGRVVEVPLTEVSLARL